MAEAGSDTIPNVSFRNVLELIAEVQLCREQARLLVAGRLLAAVDRYLASGQHAGRAEVEQAYALLGGELKPLFDEVRQRAVECQSSLDDWQSPDWLVAQTFMGITTFYKVDPDGSLWIKMHGTMDDVTVMDQLAVVREVDLFNKWVPFCDTSKLLKRLGIVELLVYFSMSIPGVGRDCVLHAYGCDSVLETGCILIQGRSVEEVPEGVEVPQVKGWRHARMDVRAFRAKIEVLSPTSARTSIVANVDPKAPVPQSVVNFVVRKMAGMFLYCLKQTAKCIRTDEGNCHRRRIVEDKGFYKEWLFPRFERFYRRQGWTVDEDLSGGDPASKLIDEPTGGGAWCPNGKTISISHGTCTPFRRKAGSQLKSSFKRLKTARRPRPTVTAESPPPQVENLGIDARLLEKWQAKRDSRRNQTGGARLLGSILFAVCAAWVRWAFTSEERAAARVRDISWFICVATVLLATGLCLVL